jgi:hypothetical protein
MIMGGSMSEESIEKKAQRSPNYPMQPLDWAVTTGLKLLEKEGIHAVSPDIIATNLGYKDASNGRARRILANLKAFGILQKAPGSKLAVSQEVRRFKLHPTEADKAILIKQWLKRPLLYSKLFDKYGENLPSDRALVFELVDEHGFVESSAQQAIDVFRASIRYAEQVAGVLSGAKDNDDNGHDDETLDEVEEPEDQVKQSTLGHQQPPARANLPVPPPLEREGVRYPIRLAGGRMAWIDVPDPFYEADKNRLRAQLEVIGTVDEDEAFRENEM